MLFAVIKENIVSQPKRIDIRRHHMLTTELAIMGVRREGNDIWGKYGTGAFGLWVKNRWFLYIDYSTQAGLKLCQGKSCWTAQEDETKKARIFCTVELSVLGLIEGGEKNIVKH